MGAKWASPVLYRILRLGLGVLFVYSGLSKAADLTYFGQVIDAFHLLPKGLTFPAGVLISGAEVILGIGLTLDRKGSLGGILAMLLGFMAVAGYALAMGYDIDCGCFGPSDPEAEAFGSLKTVLIRDFLLVAVIAYLYAWRFKTGLFR